MQVTSCAEIVRHLEGLPPSSILFIDIDDTILTPVSTTFRQAPYKHLIDDIKQHKKHYPDYEAILSHWRLNRKVQLVDPSWPATLEKLKQHRVFGLTKLDTGAFGAIPSMEEWRYTELQALGIHFSEGLSIPSGPIQGASFYEGVFFTGPNSKSQTLLYFLEYLKADTFVMIDDREEHIEDIRRLCAQHAIPFIGILFKGLSQLQDRADPALAALQKEYLTQHCLWLEDHDAEKILRSRSQDL